MARRRFACVVFVAAFAAACAEGASIEPTSNAAVTASGAGGASGSGGSQASGGGEAPQGPSSTSSLTASTSSSGDGDGDGDGDGGRDPGSGGAGGSSSSGSSSGGHVDHICNPGEYVTAVAVDQSITCAPFDAAATSAVATCRAYLGWADGCGACTTPPTKWGYATTAQCANGAGLNATCLPTALGDESPSLFGLNVDGDVDENDKFYGSLHCGTGETQPVAGPCTVGSFVSGKTGNTLTCTPASGLALGYVRESCHLYMGWQDSCNGCTTLPTKWGRVNDTACVVGAGVNSTCTVATLGGETVQLLGINTGGNVNNDDKFHWGFRCDEPTPETVEAFGSCPTGQLVHGIRADGTLVCEAPDARTAAVFRDRCTLYAGWRDSCDACNTAPSKWGSVRASSCTLGLGADNTCSTFLLGADTVQMFGLNTDGDVDDDDKFHVAFMCE